MQKYASLLLVVLIAIVFGAQLLMSPKISAGASVVTDSFGSASLTKVRAQQTKRVRQEVETSGFHWGAEVFLRIFKESKELEVWLRKGAEFQLFKTFPICYYSGKLGPKTKQGDEQAPEGFYFVNKGRLNPNSSYHLSFNLGYPNAYDRAYGRTGNYLMVHGNCVSVGCYAMTNAGIEEIYLIVEKSLAAGQKLFRVHAFPFRMSEKI